MVICVYSLESPRIMKTRLFKYIEIFTTKTCKFSDKNSEIFHISAQNIDCGYSSEPPHRGGSNEYSYSMFLSRNNENNVYPCKPQFYYIKWGLRGSKLYRYVFVMDSNEYIQHTMSSEHKKNSLNICFLELSEEFRRDSKTSSN